MALEEVEEEAKIMSIVTSGLIALFTLFSYLGDTVAIIYIYLGWCGYLTIFSIRFHRNLNRKYDLDSRNKTP